MGFKRRPWHEEANEHGGGLRRHIVRLGRGGQERAGHCWLCGGGSWSYLLGVGETALRCAEHGGGRADWVLRGTDGGQSFVTGDLRIRASALRWALLEEGEWVLEHMPGAQLVADGLTKLLLRQAFGSFLVELGMVKQGHWANKKHKKRIKIAREEPATAGNKIAREDEPATVGRPDVEEARKKGLRKLGRENEPPTKKSRADEPDSPQQPFFGKNHDPLGCLPRLGEAKARTMMAIGASLIARQGRVTEGEAMMSFQDVEQSYMMFVVGVLLAAVGAAMVTNGGGGIRTGAASATASSESSTTRRKRCNTSWNQFQQEYYKNG